MDFLLTFVFTSVSFLQLGSDDVIASGAGDDAIGLFVDSEHDSVRKFHLLFLLQNCGAQSSLALLFSFGQ